jgi:hypothetical protein
MALTKHKLGEFLEPYDYRNKDLSVTLFQGISTSKVFTNPKQVAEDISSTKIVRKGFFAYNKERLPIKTFDAVLVQQNSDSWSDGNGTRTIEKAQKLTKNAVSDFYDKTGEKPDIVLWNEAILTYGLPNSYFYYCTRPYEESLVESIFNL